MPDYLVVFTPSGKRGHFPEGTTLLGAARSLGVDLDSVCGGRGICGRCQVEVGAGDFAKHGIRSAPDHLSPLNEVEARYSDKRSRLDDNRRLGCQATIHGDLVVDVPAESQVHRQVVRKRAEAHPIAVDPVLQLYCVDVEEPDMHAPSSDFGRLAAALADRGAAHAHASFRVLRGLQSVLRKGSWGVTAAVRSDGEVVALWPGYQERRVGAAVDIGSTTIAAHLCDLATGEVLASAGLMNPQIRFGEDLMSRVSFVMLNPGGDVELTTAVRRAVNDLLAEVAREAGFALQDVLDVAIVGNPVMHHLFLGLDPTELGGAPFALVTDQAVDVEAASVGLDLAPGARVYVLPCIAGHVGADTAGMVLSEGPHLTEELRLLVDVGTNAEIVLGNKQRLVAASSPTGPAFEGAQICCGQRAAPGAIERFRIDQTTLEPRFKVIGCDLWSNEPGFADAVAPVGITGICGSGIIEIIAELFLACVISADGVIDGALTARTPRIEPAGRTFAYVIHESDRKIAVYQTDIRAIQLAKAALYAGIKLLMDRLEVTRVDRITLAGAFGSYIDPQYAMILGMIPDCPLDKVGSAGNAAGTGARIALLSAAARSEIEALVRQIEKVETAIEPRFQELFVDAMAFPNKTDEFPHLGAVVVLPTPTGRDDGRSGRRRGRRASGAVASSPVGVGEG